MTPAEARKIAKTCAEARRLARKTRIRLEADQRAREVRACLEETRKERGA